MPAMATGNPRPAYLVFDIETIPDGDLIARTRYPGERLDPAEAIRRAREEIRAASPTGSDFLPIPFHVPVALCVARVGSDFRLQDIRCVDAPHFRPIEIARGFWRGLELYRAKLVSFNGRGFDVPVLELAAFRWSIPVPHHFIDRSNTRYRYGDSHVDLLDFFTNFGAYRLSGGLNLLAKMLNKPGKMSVHGSEVYDLYQEGKLQLIN
ncbi:MAG TPA: 3'-5' exonuclease, partial [Gemmatales bacterium]|nr:3'-5' exonuclease [Gemmatales bacterium]